MINFRMLRLSDPHIWWAISLLVIIGFLMVFSVTFKMQLRLGADPLMFMKRQFLSLIAGVIGLIVFAYLDYQHLKRAAPYIYGITILLLLAVLFTGSSAQGAQRWFMLGPFSFQPSEISKLGVIIALAAFFSERKKLRGLWESGSLLILIGLPFLLVFKQPDLGTALVFGAILLGMLAASEASPRLLLLLATPIVSLLLRPILYLWLLYLLGLVVYLFLTRAKVLDWILILGINIGVGIALPFIWGALKAYQRQRIVAFLDPAADPYGAGYHTLQSKIAIGSGGIFGKGFLRGTQTQLQFIPEQHSDFIFSAVGEELGFIGAVFALLLFAVLIWRILVISWQARDDFGSLLAAGMAVMMTFHVLANTGMAVGLLPVVGIPLPFVSFGGSSLFMNLAAVGILQSIAMRRQKIIF
jgi:rod shape determining protein RodA